MKPSVSKWSMSLFLFISFSMSLKSYSQEKKAGPFTQFHNRLQWEDEGEVYWIEPFGENTLRFRGTRSLRINDKNWNLIQQRDNHMDITISKEKATVTNGKIRAEITARNGRITYYNDKNEILLREAYHPHHLHFSRQYRTKEATSSNKGDVRCRKG